MRSDERAAEAEIERSKQLGQNVKAGVKTAIGIGTTLATGGIAGRIMPFLSEFIPTDLAVKGISKISPELGKMLNEGMASGLNIKEGLSALKDKIGGQSKAQDQRNIIQQYDDRLYGTLQQLIEKGYEPLQAGALVRMHKDFDKSIKKMEQDNKTDFSSIIQTVFGSPQQPQGQGAQQAPQQPQAQQGGGQGQQALMAILQKLQQQRGGNP